jgi:hypothetical protein
MILFRFPLFLLASTILSSILWGEVPDTVWTKTFGGKNDDSGRCIQRTYDNGYIIAGYTGSISSDFDIFLIKTDSLGTELWSHTYGGNKWDTGSSVKQCIDSGFIIVGNTKSFGKGENDIYMIKTDRGGGIQWTKTYGGFNEDGGSDVQQTFDGGFIIVGETMSFGSGDYDIFVIKTDSLGEILWTRTFGGKGCDGGQSIQQTRDGGYIICGDTQSFGNGFGDVYLVKTDARGEILWTRTYGGPDFDYGESIQQTNDKGYIVVGWTKSFGSGASDIYLLKLDKYGDILWTHTYGGVENDFGFDVLETRDGGFLLVGDTKSFSYGWYDVYVVKTDDKGEILWSKNIGGTQPDEGFSLDRTGDGGYVIVGNTKSYGVWDDDVFCIKTEPIDPPLHIIDLLIIDTIRKE